MPESSTKASAFEYPTPLALTSSGAASGVQPLANGRLLLTLSSLTAPNELYVLRGLEDLDLLSSASRAAWHGDLERLTKFSADALEGKYLDAGEEFWFEGADHVQVQGWLLKPPGFKKGEAKKWPVAFLIHGGMYFVSF